jgi:hypothetical protein
LCPANGKPVCKPNFVLRRIRAAIIHLGFSLPKSSSDLPENAAGSHRTLSGQLKNRFPIWSCTTRSLPSRACYQTRWCALTAPFHPSPLRAGLFSVALVVARVYRTPGRYPARCPLVFGLSSYKFLQAIARHASLLQGSNILAKNVQQLQLWFIVCIKQQISGFAAAWNSFKTRRQPNFTEHFSITDFKRNGDRKD